MTAALTPRDEAGLYLVRRARTLVGPHQVRLLVTAVLTVLVFDLGRLSLHGVRSDDAVDWWSVGAQALVYLSLAALLWAPRAGLVAAGIALLAAGLSGGTGTEPLLLLATGALTFARPGRALRLAYAAGALVFVGFTALRHPNLLAFVVVWFAGAAVVGACLGEVARRLLRRDEPGRQAADVVAEDARLRGDERRLLTRELHDVLTHQLANISLQVMSQRDGEDPVQLRRSVRRIGASSEAALTELRLLVRVLRDDSAAAAGVDQVAELTQRVSPTAAAAHWARTLVSADFDPTITVPARADRLGMTTQRTLSRALDVIGQNIVRHATPRTACSIEVTVNDTQVVLRAANARTDRSDVTYGWGLRGLRERVDLTGGAFAADPSTDGSEWVVVISLPHD